MHNYALCIRHPWQPKPSFATHAIIRHRTHGSPTRAARPAVRLACYHVVAMEVLSARIALIPPPFVSPPPPAIVLGGEHGLSVDLTFVWLFFRRMPCRSTMSSSLNLAPALLQSWHCSDTAPQHG
jgi:hypothetical protein